MIKVFTREHVEAVSELHLKYLTGLLSELGSLAVRSFYLGVADSQCAIARVYESEGRVTGFVLGASSAEMLRKEILRRRFVHTVFGIGLGVLRKPRLLRFVFGSRTIQYANYDRTSAELIYLAVDREQRSEGIGKLLVKEFGKELRSSGINGYDLSVDAGNTAAILFYERLGFKRIGRYREYDADHFRLRVTLGRMSK